MLAAVAVKHLCSGVELQQLKLVLLFILIACIVCLCVCVRARASVTRKNLRAEIGNAHRHQQPHQQ